MDAASSEGEPVGVVPASLAGWSGTSDGGSVVLRIALGGQLRRCREAAGISREQAAYVIRASAPKISRMELGRVRFKERDIVDLLTCYGVHDETERAGFLDLVRQANVDGWWQRYRDLLPAWFETYLAMEQAASLIRTYSAQMVPGLLQTEEYARAAVQLGRGSAVETERRVQLRQRRQDRLTSPDGPHLWAVLDEAALRRPVAGVDASRRQLAHLMELADLPTVTLQVATFDAPTRHAVIGGSFTILRFPADDLRDVVYLQQLNSALYIDKPVDVEEYAEVWNGLCAGIEPPDRTARIVDRIRTELHGRR